MKFKLKDSIQHIKSLKCAVIVGVFKKDYELRTYAKTIGSTCIMIPKTHIERNFKLIN